jgi:serine/threonine protein kinase
MAGQTTNIDEPAAPERRKCPSFDDLSAFTAGRLSECEISGVFRHLAACQTCSAILEGLPNDPLAVALKESYRSPLFDEPELQRMQAAIRALPANADLAARGHDSTVSSRLSTEESAIEIPAGAVERASSPTDETVTMASDLPARIGKYEIQSLLGQGAFGRVYLARDPELHRLVALKAPRPGIAFRPALVTAFLQEARAAAGLKHPGIVTIYEVGEDSTHSCFIAMEYVEGKSLKQLLTAGPVPPPQAARYIALAAEAVRYAHKQGLIHRDLKPANLLVDGEGRVKVADFGLALFEEEQRDRAGEYAGTLAYISPEQLRGDTHHLDGRTDLYSLGVVLYELLTGRRPFGGNSEQIIEQIYHRPPKPPRQIDHTIPPELERICLRCLAKSASDRYPAAQDLIDELQRFETALATPPRTSPVSWASLAVVAALLVLAAPLWIWLYRSAFGKSDSADVELQHVAPAMPFEVDNEARTRKWLSLLDRQPHVIFPSEQLNEHWQAEPADEELWIDSPGVAMLSLGTTAVDRYSLRIEISQNAPGEAGLFFGFQPIEPRDGRRRWQLQTVTIRAYPKSKYYVQRNMAVFVEGSSGVARESSKMLGSFEVDEPILTQAVMELSVTAGRVSDIRWEGRPLVELADRALKLDAIPCDGQFGVIVHQSAATFHHARFLNLRSKPP